MATHADVFRTLEEWAPSWLAYDWDNVGLQVGNSDRETKKVLITLDVLEPVVDEAIETGADLIVAHHPLLFQGLKQIDTATPKGRTVQKLLQHDITVYASHTNLDVAKGGMNDILAERLGMQNTADMLPLHEEKYVKIAVFVPTSHEEAVKEALGAAGAGNLGAYSHCSFGVTGKGTFRPLEGSSPFIGETGKQETTEEVRIETIAKAQDAKRITEAILSAHPYEEPAYDIYALENNGTTLGLGKVGNLENEMKLHDFCEFVKQKLDMPAIRVTGDLEKPIRRCAVLGGSGEKYIKKAHQLGADVYVTGDVTFHPAQEAMELGLAVIDAGHYIEKAVKQSVKQYLEEKFGSHIELLVSQTNTDPFRFV